MINNKLGGFILSSSFVLCECKINKISQYNPCFGAEKIINYNLLT